MMLLLMDGGYPRQVRAGEAEGRWGGSGQRASHYTHTFPRERSPYDKKDRRMRMHCRLRRCGRACVRAPRVILLIMVVWRGQDVKSRAHHHHRHPPTYLGDPTQRLYSLRSWLHVSVEDVAFRARSVGARGGSGAWLGLASAHLLPTGACLLACNFPIGNSCLACAVSGTSA